MPKKTTTLSKFIGTDRNYIISRSATEKGVIAAAAKELHNPNCRFMEEIAIYQLVKVVRRAAPPPVLVETVACCKPQAGE
jgi:hypothetical protein